MYPVRSFLITLLSIAIPALATEPAAEAVVAGAVTVEIEESLQIHPRIQDLGRICRAGWAVQGCTDLPKETLECHCEKRGEAWFVDATARLRAVIHLPNTLEWMRLRAHEQMHLTDLNESLHRHLESLASRAFDSRPSCERYAEFLSTSTHLRVVMNQIRVQVRRPGRMDRSFLTPRFASKYTTEAARPSDRANEVSERRNLRGRFF